MLPLIKSMVKKSLRKLGSVVPERSNNVVKKFTKDSAHIFFGYYDITPFSYDDQLILACRVPLKNYPNNDIMDLGYYRFNDNKLKFNKLSETKAWCWQMGPRLRWLNKKLNYVAYNTFENNMYNSVIQNSEDLNIIDKYPLPFYDINKDDTLGLSLNFSSLQRLRPGYGYKNLLNSSENINTLDDGITLFNLKTRKQKKLFSVKEIIIIEPDETMDKAEHYFNHISFCPYSNNFIFFHLWTTGKMRYRRLFLYDMELNQIRLLSSNLVSHYSWKSEHEILITELDDFKLKYKLYNIKKIDIKIIAENILIEDGHPSFVNDNKILTDTYPNLIGHQKLRIYDNLKNQIIDQGSFYSPSNFTGENKCDLHPRLSRNNRFISIDTAMSGKREMLILENS